jgi:hypothetical protein
MHLKNLFHNTGKRNFSDFWAKKTAIREKLFLGAFFTFLKSTQKEGHFDTHIDLLQANFLPAYANQNSHFHKKPLQILKNVLSKFILEFLPHFHTDFRFFF